MEPYSCMFAADHEEDPTNCFIRECSSACSRTVDGDPVPIRYSDRYGDSSAAWVMVCAILMFFMKAGFLFVESSFISSGSEYVRRVVFAKYIDIFAGTFGFWLLGYAISGNTNEPLLGEEQDYIFWFFRFTFATNTATIIGGTLVGQEIQMTGIAIFIYSFLMTAVIHPFLARIFWSTPIITGGELIGDNTTRNAAESSWSPYGYCNGTYVLDHNRHFIRIAPLPEFENGTASWNIFDLTFIDFAGSGLVHVCGGIGGLILALFHKLERNKNKFQCYRSAKDSDSQPLNTAVIPDTPEMAQKSKGIKGFLEWLYPPGGGTGNVQYAALGAFILWTTWFGFNAGSTENIVGKSNHAAVGRIALNMCVSCATAGLLQAILSGAVQSWRNDKYINTNEIANAVIGGLVAITGCCPFVEPWQALIIGFISVIFYCFGCTIEYILRLHDGARVFPLHSMCGLWGVLSVGFFSKPCLIRELYENLCFCEESKLKGCNKGDLIGMQFLGSAIIIAWSCVCCCVIFLALWLIPSCSLTCLKNRGKSLTNTLFTHLEKENEQNPLTKPRHHK